MIGYHYTSKEAWEKIQQEGLVPALVKNTDLYYPFSPIKNFIIGIWLWTLRPVDENHLGNIIRVLTVHKTTQIVLLEVKYYKKELFRTHGRIISLTHSGAIGDWEYHTAFPATLVGKRIPPKRIKLLKEYDLLNLV